MAPRPPLLLVSAPRIVVGVRELETAAPPPDLDARRLEVTLAESGPRYVSPDQEFAVWPATRGDGIARSAVTITGPLGHATAGERLLCTGAFSQHPKHGWQFAVETFRSALPTTRGRDRALAEDARARDRPGLCGAIVSHFGAEEVFAELDRRPRAAA